VLIIVWETFVNRLQNITRSQSVIYAELSVTFYRKMTRLLHVSD